MAKYEAHITCPRSDGKKIKKFIDAFEPGWKYSAFDADPLMGNKPFAYLTAYDPSPVSLLRRMTNIVSVLGDLDITVLRQKIERIVYDTKTKVDEIK